MGFQPIQNKSKAQPLMKTGAKPASETPALQLSAKAVEKIKAFARENESCAEKAFRVAIDGGGCAGFRYTFAFDEVKQDDLRFEQDGVLMVSDALSIRYLHGSIIDYVDDLMGSGFTVNNPNVKSACGCGVSFGV